MNVQANVLRSASRLPWVRRKMTLPTTASKPLPRHVGLDRPRNAGTVSFLSSKVHHSFYPRHSWIYGKGRSIATQQDRRLSTDVDRAAEKEADGDEIVANAAAAAAPVEVKSEDENGVVEKVFAISMRDTSKLLGNNAKLINEIKGELGFMPLVIDKKLRAANKYAVFVRGTEKDVESIVRMLSERGVQLQSGQCSHMFLMNIKDLALFLGKSGKGLERLRRVFQVDKIVIRNETVDSENRFVVVIKGDVHHVAAARQAVEKMFQTWNVDGKPNAAGRMAGGAFWIPTSDVRAFSDGDFRRRIDHSPGMWRVLVLEFQTMAQEQLTKIQLFGTPEVVQRALGELRDTYGIKAFLIAHADCLTCSPDEFVTVLQAEGITNLSELREALEDSEYVKDILKEKGLKYFKRTALRDAIREEMESVKTETV